jgi:hypothetical protein
MFHLCIEFYIYTAKRVNEIYLFSWYWTHRMLNKLKDIIIMFIYLHSNWSLMISEINNDYFENIYKLP